MRNYRRIEGTNLILKNALMRKRYKIVTVLKPLLTMFLNVIIIKMVEMSFQGL